MGALEPNRCPVCGNETLTPVQHGKGTRVQPSGFVCGKGHIFQPKPLALERAKRLCAETWELWAQVQEGINKARERAARSRELRKKESK